MIPPVLATAAAALLYWWLAAPPLTYATREPVGDETPTVAPPPGARTASRPASKLPPLPGVLARGVGLAAPDLPGRWPNFRGPNYDAISPEKVPLARSWPGGKPESIWRVAMGPGYAAAAVARGRVYVLDHDEDKSGDVLRCLSLVDGEEIWRRSYANPLSRQHGISRTIPAVTDTCVVTLGPGCHVLCVDADTGRARWSIDLVAKYGATIPEWYAGQCPLIDAGRAIIAPGGKALMIAVDCESGEVVWETPNPDGWKMTHTSIVAMTFAGRRMYVYAATGGTVGVDAETGEVLWRQPGWRMTPPALAASPVPVGDGKIFCSGGYGAGAAMLQLFEADGKIDSKVLFRLKAKVFGSEQQTPVFYGGHIYGVNPYGKLMCLDLAGNVLWDSSAVRRFTKGYGPYMVADGLLILMGPHGRLTLAEATPRGYRELASAQVAGKESWGPMALVGGWLIVRDINTLICLDMRAK